MLFRSGEWKEIGKINRIYFTTDEDCGGAFKVKDNAIEKKTGNTYSQIVKFQDTSEKVYIDNDLSFDFDTLDLDYYKQLAQKRIDIYKSKERIK